MKNISGEELRIKRNDFRFSKQHKYLPESSLVGGKESTAMFNIAGMQQLIPYLSGKEHPSGKRLFNIQKCIRTVDIDEVGDDSHLTFFEMMGNRSLGDYFKKEAIDRSREFLVDVLGFNPKKLSVTVFQGDNDAPKDEESASYRTKYLEKDKIAFLPAKNNRRSPGPIGPCGPDTEIFYRIGDSELPTKNSNPGNDENNWLEVRNNVFMEFYRDDNGKLTKLANQNVDTGMGYERMCKVLQGKDSVYETDIFDYIISDIESAIGLKYESNKKKFRIISDHIRTSFFLIKDGISPSNEGRSYVLRRLIRRMYYNLLSLKNIQESDLKMLFNRIFHNISKKFMINANLENIVNVLYKECFQFQKTIDNGQKVLKDILKKSSKNKIISGQDSFMLYDTFGFPFELTREIALENGYQIDEIGFEKEMKSQQDRSRKGSKDMFKQDIDRGKYVTGFPATKFTGYNITSHCEQSEAILLKDFDVNGQRILIFDQSPFYAESGGQMGDSGYLIMDSGELIYIFYVKKYEGVFLHFVK